MRSAERPSTALAQRVPSTAHRSLRLLSIGQVRWQPTKLLPPMSDEEWAAEFEEYKKFPEFKVGACVRPNRISQRRNDTVRQA